MNAVTIGVRLWAQDHPEYAQVNGVWSPGLVFLRSGEIVDERLRGFAEASTTIVDGAIADLVPILKPDLVVLMTTLSDATDRRWGEDGDQQVGPLDDRYRARLLQAYEDTTAAFLGAGAPTLVWVVPPVPLAVPLDPEPVVPERYRVQQDVIREVVADAGPRVDLVELESWLERTRHLGRDSPTGWSPHLRGAISRTRGSLPRPLARRSSADRRLTRAHGVSWRASGLEPVADQRNRS